MELYCTRPGCHQPQNTFADLDDAAALKALKQKYCMTCGMPLLLEGRYLTVNLLGEGGFGAAFGARDRLTPKMRPCVVKQFKPAAQLNKTQLQTARDLFDREAEVLEQLGTDHPQIPNLFAFFELAVPNQTTGGADQFFYLVQEFIDGENLEQELARRGQYSEVEMLEVLTEILKVLDFIHGHGVIHRDIKPSNIMRHRNGKLYLLDFGAIKNVAQPGSTVIFSHGFAPPEQMYGQQIFFSSDLYALAATCVLLVTGRKSDELFDSAQNIWHWQQYASVSDRTAAVLNKMLCMVPADRFQSASETLIALAAESSPVHKRVVSNNLSSGNNAQLPASSLPSSAQPLTKPPLHRLPLLEYIGNAAFLGYESGLLVLAIGKLGLSSPLSVVIWLLTAGVLAYLQWLHIIEKLDLLVIAGITGGLVFFLWNPGLQILFTATMGGAFVLVNIALIFRLVYRLLSRFGS
jgi:serine/threonine protein kinase